MNAQKAHGQPTRTATRTDVPLRSITAAERGAILKHWIRKVRGLRISDFAAAADGMNPGTLSAYFSGEVDIATIPHDSAHRLLTGMGISDAAAWDLLHIPLENRTSNFFSRRALGLGAGPRIYATERLLLPEAVFGEVVLPAQTEVVVEPENLNTGIQIVQLDTGKFHTVSPETVPASVQARLGRLVGAHFVARPA